MHLFPSLALTILLPLAVVAAPPANLDNEYDQVRAIASRDPKVKAAFEKANERLDEKIVEIDPALRGYVKGRPQTNGTPVATPKPKPRTATPHATTHTIATGDTLSTIAAHYKVPPDAFPPHATTIDYVVSAAAG